MDNNQQTKRKIGLGLYSVMHLLVDWICIGGVLALAGNALPEEGFLYILLYNIIAFGIQPFIGMVADENRLGTLVGVAGAVFVSVALLLIELPLLMILILAFGNGLFHIGGGIYSLYYREGKAAMPGIFVAPGAIGVFLGTVLSPSTTYLVVVVVVLLVISGLQWWINPYQDITRTTDVPDKEAFGLKGQGFYLVVFSLFIVIGLRGIIGGGLFLQWNSSFETKLIVLAMIVMGKALGGILGDRFGFMKVGLGGLMSSLPLLSIGSHNAVLSCIGVFAFNLTMPITLTVLANLFKKYKGFAFGLTTLALATGYIIDTSWDVMDLSKSVAVPVGIVISIVCLYYGLREERKHRDKRSFRVHFNVSDTICTESSD